VYARLDLLSTATCRRRLELYALPQCSAMPITHSPRDFFALRRTSDIQLLRHDRFGFSFFERLGYRSIDLVLDRYLRQACSLSLRLSSKVILPNIPRLLLLA